MRAARLSIISPKRTRRADGGWDDFFPYYAGYPEKFATSILSSAELRPDSVILDPWNGSGTTTFAAAQLGLQSIGIDINPVMALVARARLLPPSEADSLSALADEIAFKALDLTITDDGDDPLTTWFAEETAHTVRSLEKAARHLLISATTLRNPAVELNRISALASSIYVALFSVCLDLTAEYRSTNPTWTRTPAAQAKKLSIGRERIVTDFLRIINRLAQALSSITQARANADILVGDTASASFTPESVDFVLTSPPYCTRIDYAAATRIQLAILAPLIVESERSLSRRMMGSTRVSRETTAIQECWGPTAVSLLREIGNHRSKASAGYYLKTHVDYFSKLANSIKAVASAVKPRGSAIFVVQDSYYKDIHNDLPRILAEIAERNGLRLQREERFPVKNALVSSHPHAKNYNKPIRLSEAVMCFEKAVA